MSAVATGTAESNWMLYGANGYTGRRIAHAAVGQGLRPILAGRGDGVRRIASELGLPVRIFALDENASTRNALEGVHTILHCAGPFSATAAPMIEACLATRTHYLDITGEIAVFEFAASRDAIARERGIVLCPGVGFDVVPTDCVAAALKAALPDAIYLALGFDPEGPLSPGTAKSAVEGLAQGGKMRRNGKIVDVPLGNHVRRIDFGRGERTAMSIPWGDVATAFHSTGIPTIECFIATPARQVRVTRTLNIVRPLMRSTLMQRWLKSLVDARVHGPTDEQLATQSTWVWGEAKNARGDVRVARVKTSNGYALTIDSALAVLCHVLNSKSSGGYYTPSGLCGSRLIEGLPRSGPIALSTA